MLLRLTGAVLLGLAAFGVLAEAIGPEAAVITVASVWQLIEPEALAGVSSWSGGAFAGDFLARLPVWFVVALTGLATCALSARRGDPSIIQFSATKTFVRLVGFFAIAAAVGLTVADAAHAALEGLTVHVTLLKDVWSAIGILGSNAAHDVAGDWLRIPAWAALLFSGTVLLFVARRSSPKFTVAVHSESQSLPKFDKSSELKPVLDACRGAFVSVAVFSAIVNVLMLTGALFMLEVYDRVLPSRSVPTLVGLGALAFVLFNAQIILDIIRNRILVRIGSAFNAIIGPRVFETMVRLPLVTRKRDQSLDPLRELDTIRGFLSSPGPVVLFDLPWMPFYLVVIFLLHPWLGTTALIGAGVLVTLALATELATRHPTRAATYAAKARSGFAESARRNAESVFTMGMLSRVAERWDASNQAYLSRQDATSDVAGGLSSLAKGLRLMLQSIVLAVGAYLVILQEASAGVIIASAILVNRALAPIDLAISQWKGFVAARQSWKRLETLLDQVPEQATPTALPTPTKTLTVERISALAPDDNRPIVRDVSFELVAGQGLGLVGPSGSGKSSVARMIVGAWQPVRGKIMLDGAALSQWAPEERGRHIGYLPQTVELMPGTVAQNIARFDPEATSESIVAAARAAGVHELILGLRNGYETDVGDHGETLSVGQRQRVALARALYGDPFLVVLDEPNSNLDADGDAALLQAILQVRLRGGIVIVVAHRPSALASVDRIVALNQGQVIANGKRDEVIAKLRSEAAQTSGPVRVVSEGADSPQQDTSKDVAKAV